MGFFGKSDKERQEEAAKKEQWLQEVYYPLKKIAVTTCDIHDHKYEIIRPCFYQVSNKGWFNDKLMNELKDPVVKYYLSETNHEQESESALGFLLYGEASVHQEEFEQAFAAAIINFKKQTLMTGGNAVIGYRQNIEIDTDNKHAWFYLQCYGTIVKFVD